MTNNISRDAVTLPLDGSLNEARASGGGARASLIAVVLTLATLTIGVISLGIGALGIPVDRVIVAIVDPSANTDRDLILGIRLPRVLLCALVGTSLAVAGLLAQALTRNPLASAQTFGINAGAGVAIVLTTIVLGTGLISSTFAAFIGAGIVGAIMWALSARTSISPVGLALAGVSLQISLAAVIQAILVMNNASSEMVFWLAGSTGGAQWVDVQLLAPIAILACILTALARGPFSLLSLDAGTAEALGQNTKAVSGLAAILVVVLAGAAVSVAGPIGFIGLIVPHIARRMVGSSFGRVLAVTIPAGALLLVASDVVARLLAYPAETPVGIVTAVIGAPAFLYLVLRMRSGKLR